MRSPAPATLHGSLLAPVAGASVPGPATPGQRIEKGCLLSSLQSSQSLLREAEICDSPAPPIAKAQSTWTDSLQSLKSGHAEPLALPSDSLTPEQQLRHSVLLFLCETLPLNNSRMSFPQIDHLSPNQWQRLLLWLDYHGLALYFFDQVARAQSADSFPAPAISESIFDALDQRLQQNTFRTRNMIAESVAIQRDFQEAGLRYALLKGLSLWPSSFSRPELRSQFDLDFLVAESNLSEAREILTRRGYRLYVAAGRSWEFKRNERPHVDLHDLYRDTGAFRVELHAEPQEPSGFSLLDRVFWHELAGFVTPTLSPFDLFLGHGLHAYKHTCSEFCRAALLLEFRRHILFHRDDVGFWETLEQLTGEDTQLAFRLGAVILLIEQVMGRFAPEALTHWTVDPLPASVRLWIRMYGHRAVLGSFPGSKLYLLLQRELETHGIRARRSIRQSLIPSNFPHLVIRAIPGESLSFRVARYRMQLRVILSRFRFHLAEGARFAWESRRWRRQLKSLAP
jgi:hypothetical protein